MERVYSVDWQFSDVSPDNPDLKNVELVVTWQDEASVNPRTFSLATVVVDNKR